LVLYRVQLEGLEAGWSAPTSQRLQRYTNLRPGTYNFRVSACNWGGSWSDPLEVRFRIIRDRQALAVEEAREHERIEADQLKTELLARSQAQAVAAQELAELRSMFVASVSHELRTPLTAIIGYADLLQTHWARFDDAARLDWISRISRSARRQQRMVEELLLLSRIELGVAVSAKEPAPLANLVARAADDVRASYHGQLIDTHGPPNLMVLADSDRTVQILVNLLDNAAKYSPEGAPIEVTWARAGTQAEVLVRDWGSGIPAEGRERLFTQFGRVQGSQIRDGHIGTGLGLYLGRGLARAMGGELDLAETGPDGTVFRLLLPLFVAS
jgi:signal transduction histidine kinase